LVVFGMTTCSSTQLSVTFSMTTSKGMLGTAAVHNEHKRIHIRLPRNDSDVECEPITRAKTCRVVIIVTL